jgi:hypothetical protein
MSLADEAFDLVRERGCIRSSAIADLLDITPANVHALLAPAVERGELQAASVLYGGEECKDYTFVRPEKAPPHRAVLAPIETAAATEPATNPNQVLRREVSIQPKEETMPSLADKLEKLFKKHGPMTSGQLREHIKDSEVSKVLKGSGSRFARLGGKTRGTIWGLPDQEAPKAEVPTGDDAPSWRRRKKPKAAKRAGGGRRMRKPSRKGSAAARKAHKTRRANLRAAAARARSEDVIAGAFRPSIAHDGAVLLNGAAKPGELSGTEAKTLFGFLERINGALG